MCGGLSCWMDGGTITNCDLGIGSRSMVDADHLTANIMVTNEATISNCKVGVCGEGDLVGGVVIVSCARFIDNRFAIGGKDMALLIDPALVTPTPEVVPAPSYFVLPTSPASWFGAPPPEKFISMCYAAKNPGGSISAEGNFFAQHFAPGSLAWSPLSQFQLNASFDVRRASNGVSCSNNFTVIPVAATATPDIPRECYDMAEACPPGSNGRCLQDCNIVLSGTTTATSTVRGQFVAGLQDLYAEQTDDGVEHLGHVSGLWDPELPTTYTNECRSFIQAARSFVEGVGNRSSTWKKAEAKDAVGFQLAPNPTNGMVTLTSEGAVSHIWVTDGLGRTISVFQEPAANLAISTATWPSGVYLVHAVVNGQPQSKRLVVQR